MKKNLILIFLLLSFFSVAHGKPIPISSLSRISIQGVINPGSASYIQMGIDRSVTSGAKALIIELDTPGGLLSSTRDIVKSISASPIPIIIFVHPGGARATSAGAIISISSHVVAMSLGTNIGAATPVSMTTTTKNTEDLAAKAKNDTAALIRAQATLRGRNVDLADEIVRKASSLSAKEALKKNIIDYIAKDLDDLMEQLDGKKVSFNAKEFIFQTKSVKKDMISFIDSNYSQKFLNLVADPNISTLLMALGGLAMYIFVNSGFSSILTGVFGIFALLLAFISLQTIPINVGAVMLLVVGIVLLIAEVFIASFGFLTISGLAAITVGSMFLVDTGYADIHVSGWLIGSILVTISIIALTIGFLFSKEKRIEGGYDPFRNVKGVVRALDKGNRSGKVFIEGEIWNFVSEEEMNIGDKVIVSKKQGLVLTVKK